MTIPLLRVLAGEVLRPPPIWLMRQAGRYLPEYRRLRGEAETFLDFCYTPALACEATLQPIRRYGLDAAIIFSDILVVPHALGQTVEFVEGRGPVLARLEGPSDLIRLADTMDSERLAPVYAAIGEVRTALAPEVAVIGFAGAPWTLASYMVEGGSSRECARTRLWAQADPTTFATLIERLVVAVADHLNAQARSGAQVLQIFDSWAGLLAPEEFERWCVRPVRAVVERVRQVHPDVPIIAYPRGAGIGYMGFALATGVDALALDWTLPPAWAHAALHCEAVLQGNLDPMALVAGGDALSRAAGHILGALGEGPLIFNLGGGVAPETPPAHVEALVGLVRAHVYA